MGRDPTAFINWEKLAEEKPKAQQDPGDKAVAGLAVASSLYAQAAPRLGTMVLENISQAGSVPLRRTPPGNEGSAKVLGMFPVHSRPHAVDPENFRKVHGKLDAIADTVDAFMAKHDLDRKGVRLSVRSGPMTSLLGPRYAQSSADKTVHLPILSKEVALHELGHAADYTSGKIGKARAFLNPMLQRSAMIGLPIAMIAGDRISAAIPGTVDDKAIAFMQENAPMIMGATLAATSLYPEAKASILALRHIKATEGMAAAKASAKKLLAGWGTYALMAIPPIVGLALARKYLHKARAEKDLEAEKTASQLTEMLRGHWDDIVSGVKDIAHVSRQIGQGTADLITSPGTAKRIVQAAKDVGTDPQFVTGALSSAIPATLAALYTYATPGGAELRKVDTSIRKRYIDEPNRLVKRAPESFRESHPLAYAGMVGLGTALSAGLMSHLFNDLSKVL